MPPCLVGTEVFPEGPMSGVTVKYLWNKMICQCNFLQNDSGLGKGSVDSGVHGFEERWSRVNVAEGELKCLLR